MGIVVGLLGCLLGIYLMLQSYSSDPPKFYVGLAIGGISFVVMAVSAIMRDKLNPPKT